MEPLYKMVHYKTILDARQFKGGPQKCYIQKRYKLYRKMTINGHFSVQSNYVRIQHSHIALIHDVCFGSKQ